MPLGNTGVASSCRQPMAAPNPSQSEDDRGRRFESGRRQNDCRELTTLGRRAPIIGGDLGIAAAARAAVRQAIDSLSGIGIVVCTAGMIQRTPFLDNTDA